MPTIQVVAKQAGVSVATVSRVINNPKLVKADTRLKVQRIIEELKYEPSVLGRNLRTAKSKLLLTLIPSISNPFYTEIINGIENAAIEQGYNILLCETGSNPEREKIYFNLLRNQLADGIISMDPTVDRDKLLEIAEKYPVVQCSEYDEGGKISYVSIDNELAAYHAVRHLVKIGHTKISLINSHHKFLYARQRREGFDKALHESNLLVNEDWIYMTSGLGFEDGQRAMRQLLALPDRPTAVFAVSDILAIGALKEINASGLRVPEDIAIIGFDKISFSNMTQPTLTTVSQPGYEMGFTSANMLINKIKGDTVDSIIFDHELVIRDST